MLFAPPLGSFAGHFTYRTQLDATCPCKSSLGLSAKAALGPHSRCTLFSVLFGGLLTASEFIRGGGGASTEEELAIHLVHLSLQAAPSTGPRPLHDVCSLASDFLVDSADDEREKLVRGWKEGDSVVSTLFPVGLLCLCLAEAVIRQRLHPRSPLPNSTSCPLRLPGILKDSPVAPLHLISPL